MIHIHISAAAAWHIGRQYIAGRHYSQIISTQQLTTVTEDKLQKYKLAHTLYTAATISRNLKGDQ